MKRLHVFAIGLLVAALAVFGCSTNQPSSDGWITLIDGDKGLENWNRVGDANWHAENGAIVVDKKTDKASSFLMTKTPYSDFQVRIEFWVSPDGNSGIYMRCSDLSKIADTSCYEAQINDPRPDGYSTGAIVHIVKVSSPAPKAGGQWNVYEITARGDHMTVVLNGVKTADGRDGKFKSGPLGLQDSAGVVKFRKVQIKPI